MRRGFAVALIATIAIGCSGSGGGKADQLARHACQEWHQAFQNSNTGHLYEQRAVIDADQAARFDQHWDTLDSDLHAYFDAAYSSQVAIDAVDEDCVKIRGGT